MAEGRIVNIASIGNQTPTRGGAYGASKSAMCGLTRQMAVAWGDRGIRANSVSPGMVRTPLSEPYYQDPGACCCPLGFIASKAFWCSRGYRIDGGFFIEGALILGQDATGVCTSLYTNGADIDMALMHFHMHVSVQHKLRPVRLT